MKLIDQVEYHENTGKIFDLLQRLEIDVLKDLGVDPEQFKRIATRDSDATRDEKFSSLPTVEFAKLKSSEKINDYGDAFNHRFGRYPSGARHSALQINIDLVNKSKEKYGEKEINALVKIVETVSAFANHDFTMHQVGFQILGNTQKLIDQGVFDFAQEQSNVKFNVYGGEIISVVFQRILLERAMEKSPILKRFLHTQILKFLRMSENFDDIEKQKWYEVLRYLVYTILDPESKEMKAIRRRYRIPGKSGMEPTGWSKIVQTSSFRIGSAYSGQMVNQNYELCIEAEDLFKVLYLNSEEEGVDLPSLITKIVERANYGIIKK